MPWLLRVRAAVQPVPLARPQIASDLIRLSALERSAEVVRYAGCRFEYWLSPRGELRAWFRLNLLLALLLAVPTILVAPVVTLFLSAVVTWSQYLLTAAVNTLLTLLVGVGIAAIVSGACFCEVSLAAIMRAQPRDGRIASRVSTLLGTRYKGANRYPG